MSDPVQDILQAAKALFTSGNITDAKRKYLEVLRSEPGHPVALHHLGLCCYHTGAYTEARNLIYQSVMNQPNNASGYDHLGVVLVAMGDTETAEACFEKAITIQPSYLNAYHNLASHLIKEKKDAKALEVLGKIPVKTDSDFNTNKLLGQAQLNLGNTEQALTHLEQALMRNSADPDVLSDIAVALSQQNRHEESLKFHSLAIARKPGENRHWQLFSDCLNTITTDAPATADVENRLKHLIVSGKFAPLDLVQTVIATAEHNPKIADTLVRWSKPELDEVSDPFADMIALGKCTPLMTLLAATPIDNLSVERILTRCRHKLLNADTELDETILPFLTALSLQCFNNEYVYALSNDERRAVAKLEEKLKKKVAEGSIPSPEELAILGAYAPLYQYDWAHNLPTKDWPALLRPIITRQIEEPLEEVQLRGTIERLTKISDGVSSSVREIYEQNPYPRWMNANIRRYDMSVSEVLSANPISIDVGDYFAPDAPEILVAGCGTGQHAIQPATRFKAAKVTALDLSLSSLAYAKRKAKTLHIDNITFAQADILNLDDLDREFDVVECVGVLHHLEDPLAGWQRLTRRLKPGGLMKIGLYSEAARQDVLAGRKIVSEQGYEPTTDGIRECRQYIIAAAAQGDPNLVQLSCRSDFHSLSACRDLIFHIQEHLFTLPQIKTQLKALNLEFLDFEMKFAGQLGNFRKEIRGLSPENRLDKWHSYETENPDTFRGMYQFWCRKPKTT